jgi:peptide/nickel transport system permease protein
MIRFVFVRILQMVPVLFGVILMVFVVTHIIPGDPVLLMLDSYYTEEEYQEMKAYLGLDRPMPMQFLDYLGQVVRGDFGKSVHSREPVIKMIVRRFPATFILSLVALTIAIGVSIPIGIVSALRHNTKVDYGAMVGAQFGISVPVFWWGLVLILFLSLYLDLLPVGGRGDPPDLKHVILPGFCLSTPFMGMTARLTRSCMLEVLRENYIIAARSRGLPEHRVILKHALKNAMIPVVTNLGLQLSRMLGGALVVEVVFRWPGMGQLAYDAILEKDFPVVMGVVLLVAVIFVIVNLIVDLSYTFFDPRIRYDIRTEG